MKNIVILKTTMKNLSRYILAFENSQIMQKWARCQLKTIALQVLKVICVSEILLSVYRRAVSTQASYDLGIYLLNNLQDPAPVLSVAM